MYMGLARIARRKDGRTDRHTMAKLLHPPLTLGVISYHDANHAKKLLADNDT